MKRSAFWKTIYTAGHDSVLVRQTAAGWRLDGMAVFLCDNEPAQIRYALDLHKDWSAHSGFFQGFVGTKAVRREVRRAGVHWTLDDVRQDTVQGALDLDFGFTPATNYPQLQRMALEVGHSTQITVAWLDIDTPTLTPLPQVYTRVEEFSFDYNSPQGPYREILKVNPDGFVSHYPALWEMVAPNR